MNEENLEGVRTNEVRFDDQVVSSESDRLITSHRDNPTITYGTINSANQNNGLFVNDTNEIKSSPIDIRRDFIKKVIGIFCYYILIASVLISFGTLNSSFNAFLLSNVGSILAICCSIVACVLVLVATCMVPSMLQKYPHNLTFSTIVISLLSFATARFCAVFEPLSVVCALGATVVMLLVLFCVAAFSKMDFTGIGIYLIVISITVSFFLIILQISGVNAGPLYMALVVVILGLVCFSIISRIQQIIGNNNAQNKFDIDSAVFAAMLLFMDVLNLFQLLLSILGKRR